MDSVLLDQATDILQATLSDLKVKEPFMTYVYSSYGFFNKFWSGRMKTAGDKIERFWTLRDTGNAKHAGLWEEDTHNVVNTDETAVFNWARATTSLDWNLIETSMNQGASRIYDVLASKYRNARRELVDEMLQAAWLTPSSSSDKNVPVGLSMLGLGTDDSTGGWNCYHTHYGDASTLYRGGVTCSSSVNPRAATYYADHNGAYDDSLLKLIDMATLKLAFEGPIVPEKLDNTGAGKFSIWTSAKIINEVNNFLAKSDDQMGFRVDEHYNRPRIKGMTFDYSPVLDTADTTRYGTDPIFGVNHELVYPICLEGWDFNTSKPSPRDNQKVVLSTEINTVYTYVMDNPQFAGFLISQQ